MRSPVLASLAVVSIGCSSQYMPVSSGHVAMTIRDGQEVYVRDGRSYPTGMFGGQIEAAVAGNPAAEHAAHEYVSRKQTGFALLLASVAVLLGSGCLFAKDANTPNPDLAMPIGALIGGVALELIGFGYTASAEPYRWDAINLFNDGANMAPQPIGPPSWSAQRTTTLRMGD